jgi:hypothetical protein
MSTNLSSQAFCGTIRRSEPSTEIRSGTSPLVSAEMTFWFSGAKGTTL